MKSPYTESCRRDNISSVFLFSRSPIAFLLEQYEVRPILFGFLFFMVIYSFSDTSKVKVCIIGAGIVGLSVALKLTEAYGSSVDITVTAELFTQQTTSYGSGGLWEPYAILGTPDEDLNRWGKEAFNHFRDEHVKTTCLQSGVQLLTCYTLLEEHQDDTPPSWSDIVYNFSKLSKHDLEKMKIPSKYTKGYTFGTYVIDQKYYLQYIMKKLQGFGVRFVQRKINNLSEIINDKSCGGYDCVINCCGLGAYSLLNDQSMYPIRGQVLRVK
jgi:D-amino-acid oxidase